MLPRLHSLKNSLRAAHRHGDELMVRFFRALHTGAGPEVVMFTGTWGIRCIFCVGIVRDIVVRVTVLLLPCPSLPLLLFVSNWTEADVVRITTKICEL